jgi:hypothetical protein
MQRTLRRGLIALAASSLPLQIAAADRYVDRSSDDFGGIGLLQMPSARMAPAGEFRVGFSRAYPYNQILFGLQWLPWLETGFRYADVRNRLYGPEAFSGDQKYKDRSVDFKLGLLSETAMRPALALGVRDLGGTGLFASEYLVVSKEIGSFDWTLGLAWGRIGARGGLRNPLASISSRFDDRPKTEARGDVGVERLFGGREIGPFGGVQWQTPVPGLSLKIEYDGNDYESEALDNDREVDSPINAALNYRLADSIDLGLGFERGNTVMGRITLHTNFARDRGPNKRLDAVSTPIAATRPDRAADLSPATRVDAAFYERLGQELERQRIHLVAADLQGEDLRVWFTQSFSNDEPRVLGRIGQTLATLAPPQIRSFTLSALVVGTEGYRVRLERDRIEEALDFRVRPDAIGASASFGQVQGDAELSRASFRNPKTHPDLSWTTGPALRQHVGGADDFYFGQLWWRLSATLALTPQWSFGGSVGADLYNNFDGLDQPSDSRLPRVRSDIVRYLKEGENNLVRLETNYAWSPSPSWYARLSAGIFEEMYGGVAGEVLYRRDGAAWALGANLNRVQQRDFDQRLGFRDYRVTTGHLTAYVDLPYAGLALQVSAGRYLAGDEGGTVELSRRFDSGVVAGIFATKTNVSSEDFGEGNFDKGIFLVLPLDLFFAKSTRKAVPLVFRPLTRDGGQKVRDGNALYGLTESGSLDRDADWSTSLR